MPNYRGLDIPFVSFGSVTSDDLFGELEQGIMDFYEAAGKSKRYHRALDIGANIGVHSILMARNGWEVKAYEPDRIHYNNFVVDVSINIGRSDWKINVTRAAVSDHDGTEVFVLVKGNTTSSHLKGDKQPYGELEEFEVQVVDCRPLFDWCDLAKIDCEGHEARLLLTVTPEQASTTDFMVEVGNQRNAELILLHFAKLPTRLWAQKNNWALVKCFDDMPTHHSHGALFIGQKEPFLKP